MQFLYSPLTWGFMLIGVPILVHLINLVRHRRQKWAAMDFLLESYRRNRRWVMLKQWLLLLARMVAMGLLVAMLAKWVSNAQWLSWLGGRTTHHYILLDDSYSMSSRQQQLETAYDRALRAIGGLTEEIASQPGDHQITLIRWSRAALAMRDVTTDKAEEEADSSSTSESASSAAAGRIDLAADLLAQTVTADPLKLVERINATVPTALQLSPETALELIQPTLSSQTGEQPIVYMLSDLRRNQFAEAESLKGQLQQLAKLDVPVHLIDCSEGEGQNLSVSAVVPEQEVWAVGVPLLVRFTVRNPSNVIAKNVVAKIRVVVYDEKQVVPLTDREYSGNPIELPPVVIESIEPGQTVSRQVQVVFPAAGGHVIEVTIPDDVLAADNSRWCTIDIRQSQKILLVDGDARQANAFFFESVIQPGESLETGMTVEKVDASYLRDVPTEELASFDVVALLDVPRMDVQGVDKLIEFAEAGGGVLMVCGQNTNLTFANEQLYRDGNGILPVELISINEPPETLGSNEPQVSVSDHPIMAPLQKLASSPFFALKIRKHLVPKQITLAPGLQVIATGPDKQPLLIDKPVGLGRSVTLLTGLSNDWSSWAQDPTFVVLALRSLGYLGSFRREATEAPAGSPISMVVTNRSVLPQGDLLMPTGSSRRVRLQRQVELSENDSVAKIVLSSSLQAGNEDRSIIDGLLRSGVFESWMTSSDGTMIVNNAAHNVAPEEGNLERISHQEIERQFPGVDLRIRNSSALANGLSSRESAQSNLLMGLLVALLLAEQMLAYSASYHAKSTSRIHGVAGRDGGVR